MTDVPAATDRWGVCTAPAENDRIEAYLAGEFPNLNRYALIALIARIEREQTQASELKEKVDRLRTARYKDSQAMAEQQATIKRYEKAFRHTHEAKRVDGVLVDECGICGLDIREDVHERAALAESEGDDE